MHQNVAPTLTHSSLNVLRSLLAKVGQVNLRRVGRTGGLAVKEHLAMREGMPHGEAEQFAGVRVGVDVTDRERSRVALDAAGTSALTRAPWRWLRSNWCVGSLVGAMALGLGLYHIGEPSLWFDEMLSVERASQPLPMLWRIVNASQPNMALYYFILHFWLRFTSLLGFQPTEAVVRFPSAVFAAGAVVVLFLLVRHLFGLLVGLTGAALYMFNTVQLIDTQDTRSYALQLLFLIFGWYALLMALTTDRHQKRWLIGYVVAMTLAVYTHYFSLLVLFAQGVALLALLLLPTAWQQRTRTLFRPLLVSLSGITILVLPMMYASRVGAQTGWLPIPEPKAMLSLLKVFANGSSAYLLLIGAMTVLGLLTASLASFPDGQRLLARMSFVSGSDDKRMARYQLLAPFGLALICWLWAPIIVSYVVTHISIHLFSSRYLVATLPAFCLLAVLGLWALPWRWVRAFVALGLVLLAMIFVPNYYASAQVEQWNTGAFWIEQHYQPNDGLVCYDNLKGCQVGLEYYFHAYPTQAHFDADSPGSFSYVQYDLQRPAYTPDAAQAVNPAALQQYAAEHPRLFYIIAHLGNQTEVQRSTAAVAWLNSHYQLIGHMQSGTVNVYLYNTR